MKDSRINYVLVGGFVLAMVAVLVAGLVFLSKGRGPTDTYYTVYTNVGGLGYGTQVLYEGYPIGQVEAITPQRSDGAMRFRVEMSIREGWAIPDDSLARMAASGLLSALSIDIKGGRSDTLIPPGGVIPGSNGGSIFAALSDIAGQVEDISDNGLKPLLDKLNVYTDQLGGAATQSIPDIAENLRRISADLAERTPEITRHLAGFSRKLDEEVLKPENVAGIDRIIANSQAATDRFTSMGKTLEDMSLRLHSVIGSLDTLVTGNAEAVDAAVGDMRYSLDAVARNIDSITFNLDATSRNMAEFSRAIRQNPGLLIGGTPQPDEDRRR
jgi:phospholipid/cholesterol/gamma-HCH transport system substrate-binding protein